MRKIYIRNNNDNFYASFATPHALRLENFDTYASRLKSRDPYAFEIDPYSHPALPIESNRGIRVRIRKWKRFPAIFRKFY